MVIKSVSRTTELEDALSLIRVILLAMIRITKNVPPTILVDFYPQLAMYNPTEQNVVDNLFWWSKHVR